MLFVQNTISMHGMLAIMLAIMLGGLEVYPLE